MTKDRPTETLVDTDPLANALGNNPALFRELLEAAGAAISIYDRELTPIFVNQAFTDLYGYTAEDMKNRPMSDILPKESIELLTDIVHKAVGSGQAWEGEYVIKTRDGMLRVIQGWFDPVFNDAGEVTHVISVKRETSDCLKVEQELATAQKSLSFITNSTSDIFFRLLIPEGVYDYLSPSVERFSGYSIEEYTNNSLFIKNIIHPDWVTWFEDTWEDMLKGVVRPEYEFPYIHKSGQTRWAHQRVILLRDRDGKPMAIEGIATDITERKLAEEAVKASEEKFRFLTETISDVIWTMDTDFRFTYATPSAETSWGYPMEKIIGTKLQNFIVPSSLYVLQKAVDLRQAEENAGDYSSVHRVEMEHYKGDGTTFWVETAVRRLLDENGNPRGYQGLSRDVSEQKHINQELAYNESRFRTLFEDSPISLWEEDLTRLKKHFDDLKAQGVKDFRLFFYDHPEELAKCATLVDVVSVNKATLDLLRAKNKEDLLGNLDKVLTESSMEAFTEEMILLASGGCEYCGEITHMTLDGETIWVMVHFFVPPEYEKTLSRVIVSLIDVTPRKRAEQALKESEERYRVLAENSQEGVVVKQNGIVKYINDSMSEIFGYSIDELNSIHPLEICHPEDREFALKQLDGLVSGHKQDAFASFRIINKHQEVRWVTLMVKPITWGDKKAQLEIFTDVTHHKTLEEELLAAHALMEDRIRKRTAELSRANVRLKAEAEERTKAQERILSLSQQIIRIQEDERQRIARDLHDNVAQDLSTIMLKMETLFDDHRVDSTILERGEAMADILRNAIASVRDIAYGLRPPALDQQGLVNSLKSLCSEKGQKYGFHVEFMATGIDPIDLDYDTEINIYRMVQEAMGNIGRHAKAKRVIVRMVKSHPDILIRIEDNGCGFDVNRRKSEAYEEKRMGLRSMEERARFIGGTMNIQSLEGTGTRVVFKFPIEDIRRKN